MVFAGSLLCVLVLSSCATTYQPLGPTGGYSDIELGNDEYDVSFKGNPLITEAQVRDMALLRCAELTLAHDHESFVVWADSSFSEVNTNRTTRDQPWKQGGSSINQATANPDVNIDTEQVWFTARFIIKTYPKGTVEHAYARMNAMQILEERRHLLK